MRVIVKHPGQHPRQWNIANTLESLESVIGGDIKITTLFEDLAVICDKEGTIKGLPYNCEVLGIDFVGLILFAGIKGGELIDIPGDLSAFRTIFPCLWED